MSYRSALGLLVASSLIAGTVSAAQTPVVVGAPAAPLPSGDGTGLCVATKVITDVSSVPGTAGDFAPAMNALFAASPQDQTTSVHRAPLDLSNNLDDGRTLSFGDFTAVACSQAGTGGCPFAIAGASTPFGVRLRGFLRVGPSFAGHAIHLGAYADDAMSRSSTEMGPLTPRWCALRCSGRRRCG